jgi:hypothetical protein
MNEFKVDSGLLAKNSTEEILRILREEHDDYTPEAIKTFHQILESRGVNPHGQSREGMRRSSATSPSVPHHAGLSEARLIHSPGDAVRVLDEVLRGVLEGKTDPDVGRAAAYIVGTILQAMEREFMTDTEEGT